MLRGIASGMRYLSDMGYVHRVCFESLIYFVKTFCSWYSVFFFHRLKSTVFYYDSNLNYLLVISGLLPSYLFHIACHILCFCLGFSSPKYFSEWNINMQSCWLRSVTRDWKRQYGWRVHYKGLSLNMFSVSEAVGNIVFSWVWTVSLKGSVIRNLDKCWWVKLFNNLLQMYERI